MSDLDDISCIIRTESGCNYASGDKAAVAVLAWLVRGNMTEKTITAEECFVEALQEITEAKGAFRKDPFEHAKNVIRDMQAVAIEVLTKHGIKPRGQPLDER